MNTRVPTSDFLMFSHRRVLTNIVLRREKGRYRTRSAIGSAIGRALSRPISCKPLRGAQPRGSGATYCVHNPFKTSAKQKRDRGCDSQPRPRPRLNSQSGGLECLAWSENSETVRGIQNPIFCSRSFRRRIVPIHPNICPWPGCPCQQEKIRCMSLECPFVSL